MGYRFYILGLKGGGVGGCQRTGRAQRICWGCNPFPSSAYLRLQGKGCKLTWCTPCCEGVGVSSLLAFVALVRTSSRVLSWGGNHRNGFLLGHVGTCVQGHNLLPQYCPSPVATWSGSRPEKALGTRPPPLPWRPNGLCLCCSPTWMTAQLAEVPVDLRGRLFVPGVMAPQDPTAALGSVGRGGSAIHIDNSGGTCG